jgi:hypothetical protein
MMKKFPFVVLAALVLTGCLTRPPEQQQPPATIEQAKPAPSRPHRPPRAPLPAVPTPPKIKTIDWQGAFAPLMQQMIATQGVNPGSTLLINRLKNNTNGNVQTGNATDALYAALASNGKFTLIPQAQMSAARQTLGLSADDSLETRGKAIGLARYVNAQYVLYSDASGDARSPTLEMQLILVQSGEIIWSGKGQIPE